MLRGSGGEEVSRDEPSFPGEKASRHVRGKREKFLKRWKMAVKNPFDSSRI